MLRIVATLVVVLTAAQARAADVTIKLGTLAPQGSTWHQLLKEMSERFADVSGGAVKVKIYAGGTQGGESDMVRKMNVSQLQAASMSNVGLHDISGESMLFSAPGMVDEDIVGAVLAGTSARMSAALEAKGFIVLHWARVGTVRIFCKKPYKTPAEAAEAKFFAWDGDPGSVEAFKMMGFHPVVLSSTDIIPSIETGMINCVTQAPAYVLTTRLFEKTNQMIDFPWSYLIGATVVRKDTWEKIAPELRVKLLAIAEEYGHKVDSEVRKLNDDAIEAMKRQGLQIVKVEPGPWEVAAKKSWPAARGKVVPAEFFDVFVKLRAEAKNPPAPKTE